MNTSVKTLMAIGVMLVQGGVLGRGMEPERPRSNRAAEKAFFANGPFNRPPATAIGANNSTTTLCAEEDNVNVPLWSGDSRRFTIEAANPTHFQVTTDNCDPDFTNCPMQGGQDFTFTPLVQTLFDDHDIVVQVVRQENWYLPNGMKVAVDFGPAINDVHFIRIHKKIPGVNSWPEVVILYMDGNVRLIPFPPAGRNRVCFGSSVLVGPAAVSSRPRAEIKSVRYSSVLKTLRVLYKDGSRANIRLDEVNRDFIRLSVRARFPDGLPFVTFRSMFISPTNCDVGRVSWRDAAGVAHDVPIMDFSEGTGTAFFFYRDQASQHNTSAPNIRIALD